MIKSLTNLENKKGPNYVKQKNFLILFLFCFVLFVCLFVFLFLNWDIYAYLLTAKPLKRFVPSRYIEKILVIN